MPKTNQTPAVDLSTLSAAELAKLLAQARKAEKEQEEKAKSLPQHAFVVVMSDSTYIYWSGRAASETDAKTAAQAYAMGKAVEGVTVFDMAKRPIPQPRGRKASIVVQ